ncbi:uncharacterized protein LDX57_012514 [Aspergillus melleus]|uniref:uncharacterized protein n=1 Tax=Aspergillus melleus TaxID=138277 RepID=UPI001E8DA730|nr:uncharacterized protein LDX57_012514 [Aspergillus melleus]KAH8434883.1 hypothetical protein LDX57_012514 [Aspergillus melleus]
MPYTLEQVKTHNKPDDVWIVLHNKVYDITKYLEDHPGGSAILLEVAGTDATDAFEEVGHSDEAREQLEPFYVGDLPAEEQTEMIEVYRPTYQQVSQAAAVNVHKPSFWTKVLRAITKLGLTGLVGTAAVTIYQHDLTPQVLQVLRNSTGNGTSYNGSFWTGAGIATISQLTITCSLGLWLSSKLDVQQEFTHYKPRRATHAATLIPLRRTTQTPASPPILHPKAWRSLPLSQKTEIAPNVYRLVFSLPNATDTLPLPIGQHIAVQAQINTQAISRSYTPISSPTDAGQLTLLVKTYPNGKMTSHMASLSPGDCLSFRGPKGAMKYTRNLARTINMIAGGTGITPMYQVLRAACTDPLDGTKINLLYANNTERDILLREELDTLARLYPDQLNIKYVLSQPDEDGKSKWTGYRGFVNEDMMKREFSAPAKENRLFLCGPPGMIEAMKKVLGGLGWTVPGGLVARGEDQVFVF